MKIETYLSKLMDIFPDSFINRLNELILIPETNLYFRLNDVESEFDVKCKLLEWCSRDATKAMPYQIDKRNKIYQDKVRVKINKYLGTDFNREQMEVIYCELGNKINHSLTIKFIENSYDFNVFEVEE